MMDKDCLSSTTSRSGSQHRARTARLALTVVRHHSGQHPQAHVEQCCPYSGPGMHGAACTHCRAALQRPAPAGPRRVVSSLQWPRARTAWHVLTVVRHHSRQLPLAHVEQAGRRHDARGGREQLRGRVPVARVAGQQRSH
ncbi:hypothetical protein ACJJTC_002108 [Scirpophaga incertulas]